jgi:outer membrane lipoprotein-sorting protein
LREAPGPTIGDEETVAITLDVADPMTDDGLTREVLYVSTATHFPLRRENFIGSQLVERLEVKQIEINVGLTADDFPW